MLLIFAVRMIFISRTKPQDLFRNVFICCISIMHVDDCSPLCSIDMVQFLQFTRSVVVQVINTCVPQAIPLELKCFFRRGWGQGEQQPLISTHVNLVALVTTINGKIVTITTK